MVRPGHHHIAERVTAPLFILVSRMPVGQPDQHDQVRHQQDDQDERDQVHCDSPGMMRMTRQLQPFAGYGQLRS
jgi:hypothetical protein